MSALDAIVIDFDPAAQAVLQAILVVMMVSVALSLRVEHFVALKGAPLRFLGAAAAQILALPALTFAIVAVFRPPPSIALGMIVVACCPGGAISNFLTHLARGDTALSVSLTATSSVLAALATPVSIVFWTGLHAPTADLMASLEVSPLPFVARALILLGVPLALGMAFAMRFPRAAARIRPGLSLISLLALIGLIAAALMGNRDLVLIGAAGVMVWVIGHNTAALALGWISGRALGFGAAGRRAMTFEVGMQNSGLGLVILLSQFGGLGGAAAVTALWGVWHMVSGLGLAGAFRLADHLNTERPAQTVAEPGGTPCGTTSSSRTASSMTATAERPSPRTSRS